MAKHNINLVYRTQLQNLSIVNTETMYLDRTAREAIEVELHSNNMNTEDGLCLSNSWTTLNYSQKT
jgi:hypothetical protein